MFILVRCHRTRAAATLVKYERDIQKVTSDVTMLKNQENNVTEEISFVTPTPGSGLTPEERSIPRLYGRAMEWSLWKFWKNKIIVSWIGPFVLVIIQFGHISLVPLLSAWRKNLIISGEVFLRHLTPRRLRKVLMASPGWPLISIWFRNILHDNACGTGSKTLTFASRQYQFDETVKIAVIPHMTPSNVFHYWKCYNGFFFIKIALKFGIECMIGNNMALVQVKVWYRTYDKLLVETMAISSLTHTSVTGPLYFKTLR